MYHKPTVPQSIGGVLDDSLQLYKASLPSCWIPTLLVTLIAAALSYLIIQAMPVTAAPLALTDLMSRYSLMLGQFGILYLVVIILSLVFYGMLVINISAVSRGEVPTFGASLAKAARRAPALFVASLVFAIAIAIGFILLLIPGFYIWNRLQLYIVPLIDESQGPFTSLGSSWRAVSGNWWRTAIVVFVMFVLVIVLEMVIALVAGLFAGIGTATGSARIGSPADLVSRVQMVTLLIGSVVRIFTIPLIFAVFVALYRDLLLRKGGADLEARLGALPKG